MQPGDIHFAAVWPATIDGTSRKAIVPFQCSLAEASKTIDCLPLAPTERHIASGPREIATCALGSFCVFSTYTQSPSALLIVGTKSWSCAPNVIGFMRRVETELARDPADFGYWQLRSLAWLAEEAPPCGDDGANHATLPRLLEGHDWEDEESESWEDDDMWSGLASDSPVSQKTTSARASPTAGLSGENTSLCRLSLPSWSDSQAGADPDAKDAAGTAEPERASSKPASTATTNHWNIPLNETKSEEPPHDAIDLPPRHGAAPLDARFTSSAMVDRRTSPVAGNGGGSLPLHPAQAPAPVARSVDATVGFATFGDSVVATSVEPSAAETVAPPRRSEASVGVPLSGEESAAAAVVLATPATAGRSGSDDSSSSVAARNTEKLPATDLAEGRVDATTASTGAAHGDAVAAAPMVSVAVSEDLMYVHKGSTLQSYAIIGSVAVAAPSGIRARLRVTDKHGHIATATANDAVAEETADTGSVREFLCTAGAAQAAGVTTGRFLPVLKYKCSPAVQQLPVRVSCRLRAAGAAVLVWVQVIANPQLSRSLSGVSVLVHLPFSPRQEEDGVKSEPPATLKANNRVLEWVLPTNVNRGGKQIMQARLIVDETEMRVADVPPTALAMVKCHLLDSIFSSVELDVSAVVREGEAEVAGKVMKRCRIQSRQQA